MKRIFKSKKLAFSLLLVAGILICATGLVTLALVSDTTDPIENTFELGNVTTEIEEVFEQTQSVTTFKKEPVVVNTGENDCYVRVRVSISPEEALLIVGNEQVFGGSQANWGYYDGYYYYKTALKPGEKTTPLFNTVTVKNEYIDTIEGFEVTVYQEAVQAKMSARDGSVTTDYSIIWAAYDAGIVPDSFN